MLSLPETFFFFFLIVYFLLLLLKHDGSLKEETQEFSGSWERVCVCVCVFAHVYIFLFVNGWITFLLGCLQLIWMRKDRFENITCFLSLLPSRILGNFDFLLYQFFLFIYKYTSIIWFQFSWLGRYGMCSSVVLLLVFSWLFTPFQFITFVKLNKFL